MFTFVEGDSFQDLNIGRLNDYLLAKGCALPFHHLPYLVANPTHGFIRLASSVSECCTCLLLIQVDHRSRTWKFLGFVSYLAFPNHSLDNGLPSPFLLSFYSWARCSCQDSCKVAHFYPRLTGAPFHRAVRQLPSTVALLPDGFDLFVWVTVINLYLYAIINCKSRTWTEDNLINSQVLYQLS